MKWSVEFDDQHKVVRVKYFGPLSLNEFRESIYTRVELAKNKDSYRVLIDAAEMIATPALALDTYDVVSVLYEMYGGRDIWKFAITAPCDPNSHDDIKLYENLCVNRGWTARMFDDVDTALEWLCG